MLYDFPRQRTVIAHTAVTVWIMDQETYQRFVADDDDIRSELEANLVQVRTMSVTLVYLLGVTAPFPCRTLSVVKHASPQCCCSQDWQVAR